MNTYIALLRGINVSGQKKINMKDLAMLLENAGLKDVVTYIQSGNLVFNTNEKKDKIQEIIEKEIREAYSFEVPTKILTNKEITAIIDNNPFQSNEFEKNFLYVYFLFKVPEQILVSKLREIIASPDKFIISGSAIYVYCPGGYGRTKYNNTFFEKKLKVKATSRNWKTVQKLIDLSTI